MTITDYSFYPWDHQRDWPLAKAWFEGHNDGEAPPETLMPCFGAIIADNNDMPRAIAWYIIDPINQQAYLSYFLANPQQPLTRQLAGALLQEIAGMAREQGANLIWAHTHDERVTREAVRLGFQHVGSHAALLAGKL